MFKYSVGVLPSADGCVDIGLFSVSGRVDGCRDHVTGFGRRHLNCATVVHGRRRPENGVQVECTELGEM